MIFIIIEIRLLWPKKIWQKTSHPYIFALPNLFVLAAASAEKEGRLAIPMAIGMVQSIPTMSRDSAVLKNEI